MLDLTGTNSGEKNLIVLIRRGNQLTFTEMRGTPAGEDLNEGRAVFALPPLPGLVQSPGIAVNQLLDNSFSPAGLG